MTAPAPVRPVDAIADRYVTDYSAADPVTATYIGVAGHDERLTDYSPDGFAEREELDRRTLAALESAEPSDERERVAKDSMLERLRLEVERSEAGIPQSGINVIDSPMHSVREAFDLMDTSDEASWEVIATRLEAVPHALDGYQATLTQCAARGQVAARRQVLACAEQCRGWTSSDSNVFATMVAAAPRSSALSERLESGARQASEAYTEFGRFLAADLAPRARSEDGVGRDAYALASRYFLGAVVDLDETYAWGWDELARIEQEMAKVADTIVSGGGVDEAVAALDADPKRTIAGKEAFRDWMQALAGETISALAGVHFDIPEPIRRIECRIAPTSDGNIYYTGPSEDLSRPGRMWWAVPEGVESFSTWREVTTVYHEGVPGHHLQVAQTAYRRELLNRWQRLMCWVSGHGEGWALYSERLMADLGHLDDPGDRLGMLDAQGLRAARVIVDIGIHLGLEIPRDNPFGFHPGKRWTAELVLEFLLQHTRMEEAVIRFERDRYLGWPGQAPSYKVGERIWLAAREEVRRRRGADFDLKEFHRQALDLGALGLDPLRDALTRL